MSDLALTDLLEACGLTLEQLDASEDERPCDFVVSEKVAALVERAIEDERRRCMEIAETGERAWRSVAEQLGDQRAAALAWGKADACGKIARLIGEGL